MDSLYHTGQRTLKMTGDASSVDVNAWEQHSYGCLNHVTLYPSPYMVLSNKGYTNVTEVESRASSLALPRCSNVTERKHYYAGTDLCASREQSQACLSYAETKQSVRSNRVAARLGGGGLDALQHVIAIDDELQWKADQLFKQSLDQVNHRVLGENDLDCITNNEYAREEFGKWIDGIPYLVQADVKVDYWQFKDMIHSMLDDPNNGKEKEVYFYHSDLCGSRAQSQTCLSYAEMQQSVQSNHLGSASWITDYRGMAVQHIQYLPYGEPYINQRPFGYSERFTFTGKDPRKGWRIPLNEIKYNEQRDALRLNPQSGGLCGARLTSPQDLLTGYGYLPRQARQAHHGARYMDHELMTMWLSVDPMADKYPSISPYAYCAWNPVKLVDPDGRDVYIIGDEKSKAEALRQIQQKSKNMTFSIDKNGKLSFEGEAKTKRERYMANIINSENVHVNLKVQNHSNHNGQTIDIGGFDGNALSEDGKSITTFQVINVAKSGNQDIECDNLGNMIWHEISESYEGGLISLTNQKNAPPAIKGNDKTVYRKAHYAAGRFFPGTTNEGTVRDYIESFPREIQNLIPEGYKVLNGHKQKSWYSR